MDTTMTNALLDALSTILVQIVIPLFLAGAAAAVGSFSNQAAKYIGQKRTDALRQDIANAIVNGLLKSAGAHSPGSPTFAGAVTDAVGHVRMSYPEALTTLGANDRSLQTMATAALDELIAQGRAKVQTNR